MNGSPGGMVLRGMERCELFRSWVAAEAGGDLDAPLSGRLRSHLAACPACSLELAEYKNVILLARAAFQDAPELPGQIRRRLAASASEAALKGRLWHGWFTNPLRPALAGATAAAALLLAVLIVGRAEKPVSNPLPYAPVRIEMQVQQDGRVRLAWQDGRREVYTVRKSADPRGLAKPETHIVRGNTWVDDDPASSPVVFYQVN